MLKKTCILLLIATLPALAEPQFTSFEIFLLFLYGYILLVFDVFVPFYIFSRYCNCYRKGF